MSAPEDQRWIVVGVDGSPRALDAVRWAGAEATRRRAGLRLVTAVDGLDRPVLGFPVDAMLEQARQGNEDAAAAAAEVAPAVTVDRKVEMGHPVAVLAAESQHAGLLVVGASGFGRIAAVVAGSVAVGVCTQAACPVVVVRGEVHDSTTPVILGVDASPVGGAAIAFAFEAAASRGVPVMAVHTWGDPPGDVRIAAQWMELADQAKRRLAERLAGWTEKYPDVRVQRIVIHSQPARGLLELSENAQLVVVGSRGHGELVGLILDSVSNAMLHRAACPVAVVRPQRG
ncbi:universal stress protein [Pseudonocardia adelaidensis]|uniref:Universal stress protein n=1 Tax=Pseudonocardia adelaidensis TaxID=648754 RepID=A0ABP9NAH6_9PSEU